MGKHVLVLANTDLRAKAIAWIKGVPDYTRVEFFEPKRTIPQNALLHLLLGEVAKQRTTLGGTKMTAEKWKRVFMNHLGNTMEYLPTLEGDGFFPMGYRTSDLSVPECSALIESIYAWGATEGLTLSDPADLKQPPPGPDQ